MDIKFIKTELLLYATAKHKAGYVCPSHSHAFWQIEIIGEGKGKVIAGKKKFFLEANDIFIIPPGVVHHFKYESDSKIASIRFNVLGADVHSDEAFFIQSCISENHLSGLPDQNTAGNASKTSNQDDFLKNLISSMLVGFLKNTSSLSSAEKIFMEYSLASIISIHYSNMKNVLSGRRPSHIEKAVNYIERNKGKYLAGSSVAKVANCSSGYLSALFRKHQGMSLKCFIDKERADFIRQYLLYSDLTISEIAQLTGFVDIYSFSRFFKRLAGESPSACRRASLKFPGER